MSNIYHYTSLDAAVEILQEDNICFKGTRYDSMNDPTDCIYARDIVIRLFKEVINESNLDEYEKDDSEAFPYIVSFSKIEDDFNMWRMYKSDVALEFDRDLINDWISSGTNKTFVYFKDCEYPETEEDIHRAFVDKLNEINQGQGMMLSARHVLAFIKRKDFKNEQEVRLVEFDHEGATFCNGNFENREIPQNIEFRTIRKKDVILCKRFLLPQKALTGIIINSNGNEHFESLKKHINLLLLQRKYTQQIDIRKSKTGNYINLNI